MRTAWIGLLLLIAATAFAGRVSLGGVLRRYDGARTAAERRAAVVQLAECTDARTGAAAHRIARQDSDIGVRVAAVEILALRTEDTVDAHLLELTVDGGPQALRRACASALALRPGATALVRATLASPRATQLDRLRLVDALAGLPSLDAYAELLEHARGDDPALRAAALRATATHPIGRTEIGDTLLGTLREFRDLETVVTVLDLVETHALERWTEFEPLVATRTEPAIEEAVITLGELHAFVEGQRRAEQKHAEGYAVGADETPPEPLRRTRLDVVYAFDATGSTVGQIARVKRFIQEHAGPLVMVRHDARIGIVAYRAAEGGSPRAQTEILPLTHDVGAALRFVDGVDQRGADSQGAAVAHAVATALDRMPWRENARRQVYVLADGRIDDRARAWRIARQHHDADRTQLSVWYWSRTRIRHPDDLERLAKVGGGTFTIADARRAPPIPGTGTGSGTGTGTGGSNPRTDTPGGTRQGR